MCKLHLQISKNSVVAILFRSKMSQNCLVHTKKSFRLGNDLKKWYKHILSILFRFKTYTCLDLKHIHIMNFSSDAFFLA